MVRERLLFLLPPYFVSDAITRFNSYMSLTLYIRFCPLLKIVLNLLNLFRFRIVYIGNCLI